MYCGAPVSRWRRPSLLLCGFLGLVDALADTGLVTLAAGALLGFGVLLAHGKNLVFLKDVLVSEK